MNSDFGNDYVTISDDEGNDYVLEHIDTIELDDTYYLAFLPTDIDEDDDEYGLIILQTVEENGEEVLTSIDDDEFLETLFEKFMERFAAEEEQV